MAWNREHNMEGDSAHASYRVSHLYTHNPVYYLNLFLLETVHCFGMNLLEAVCKILVH